MSVYNACVTCVCDNSHTRTYPLQHTTLSPNTHKPKVQMKECFDNNYAPTKPEDYIRLRILKMLRFYRNRLPNYARQRDFCQWVIMVGTVAGALIAFLGFAPQVAIVTSVTTSVAAWLEFHSTAQKVNFRPAAYQEAHEGLASYQI